MAQFIKEGKMMSNHIDSYLANAKVMADSTAISAPNGGLVVLGALLEDTTYEASGLEYDTYKASKVATAASDEVVIIDYAGVNEIADGANVYKMGIDLANLTVPAGTITRVRRLALHDKFWLAAGNFDTTPVVGEYAIAEAAKFTHKVANAIPNTGYCVKVLLKKGLVVGMKDEGYMYLCEVVQK